jgi:hypothetical protein
MPGWILMGDNFQPGTLTLVIDPDPRRVTPNPKLSKKTFPGVEFLYTSRDFRARLRPIPVQKLRLPGAYGAPGTGLAGSVGTPPGSVGTAGNGLAGSLGANPVPGTVGSWLGRAGVGAWPFSAPWAAAEPFDADEFDAAWVEAGPVCAGDVAADDGEAAFSVAEGLGTETVGGAGTAGMVAGDVGAGAGTEEESLAGWKIRTTAWPTLLRKSSLEAATAPAPSPMAPTTAAPTTTPIRRCRLRRCCSKLATSGVEARRIAWVETSSAAAPCSAAAP